MSNSLRPDPAALLRCKSDAGSAKCDPQGDTYVPPTAGYASKGSEVTYGWVNTSQVQGCDRNAQLHSRQSGINCARNGWPATSHLNSSSPGTHDLSKAMAFAGAHLIA